MCLYIRPIGQLFHVTLVTQYQDPSTTYHCENCDAFQMFSTHQNTKSLYAPSKSCSYSRVWGGVIALLTFFRLYLQNGLFIRISHASIRSWLFSHNVCSCRITAYYNPPPLSSDFDLFKGPPYFGSYSRKIMLYVLALKIPQMSRRYFCTESWLCRKMIVF